MSDPEFEVTDELASFIGDLHDSEINGEISWFYDGVWGVKIGDQLNGYQAEATFTSGVTSKKQNLDATTYSALLQQVDAADFFNLKDTYDKGGVADDIYYTVTVKEPRRSKTVKVAQVGGKALAP